MSGNEAGGVVAANALRTRIDQQFPIPSAYHLSTTIDVAPNGNLRVQATVTIADNGVGFEVEYNRIFLGITANGLTTGQIHAPLDRDFTLVALDDFELVENIVGQTGVYTKVFDYQPVVPLENYTGIAFIQYINQTGVTPTGIPTYAPLRVHQAALDYFSANAVAFTADATAGFASLTVSFTNLSHINQPITGYLWDFGDGNTSTVANPTHTYTAEGEYNVTLTITTATSQFVHEKEGYIWVFETGAISGNVSGIWGAGQVVEVMGDITVPAGSTLEIREGAQIRFHEGRRMNVFGELIVLGTEDSPVLFTSYNPSQFWYGMVIEHNVNTNDPIEINHAIFEKARCAIQSAMANLVINHCVFRDNVSAPGSTLASAISLTNVGVFQSPGPIFSGGGVEIRNSFFHNNRNSPITAHNTWLRMHNTVMANNSGNSAGAIFVSFRSRVEIENCTIVNNQHTPPNAGSIYSMGSGTSGNGNNGPIILKNSIIIGNPPIFFGDNTGRGIVDHTLFIDTRAEPNYYSASMLTLRDAASQNIFADSPGYNPATPIFTSPTTGVGVNFQTTNKNNWTLVPGSIAIDKGDPDEIYNDIEDQLNPGMAKLPSRGTVRNDMGAFGGQGIGTSTDISNEDLTPLARNIHVNAYPNPFNPSLNLSISVKDTAQKLNVSIYNVRGQKVTELMNEVPTAAHFHLTWDGADSQGRAMSTGIYFVNVSNADEMNVRKVMLLK
jgi:PKD repeat protein